MKPEDRPLFVALLAVAFSGFAIAGSTLIKEPAELDWDTVGIVVTGLFTVVLAVSTIGLWWATKAAGQRADAAIRTIERAYVKMSHHPPGLTLEEASGLCWLSIQVKNFGHTPARVTNAFLTVKLLPNNEALPGKPKHQRNLIDEVYKVFLVTDDHATYYPIPFGFGPEKVPLLQQGTLKLYLIGHVDYTDMFERHYRAGYARLYQPEVDKRERYDKGEAGDAAFANRSNLVFVTEDGYNYDICLDEGMP